MSEAQPTQGDHRARPTSQAFRDFIGQGWGAAPEGPSAACAAAPFARSRRAAISAAFPGERLVIPAGGLKVRSNDCDFRFRPHSAFAHLTGLGADREPDAVLVLEPTGGTHESLLFFRPPAARSSAEFYSDTRYGELWVGPRQSLPQIAAELDIATRDVRDLPDLLATTTPTRIIPGADPAVAALVAANAVAGDRAAANAELAQAAAELRLVKDPWEIDQLRRACTATAAGFERIAQALPEAISRGRGERWIEGQFELIARHLGNGVGYDTIAAAGAHACTLHWIRNDGPVRPGDLVLIDAGVELDSLYTADVTRTLPANGTFTPAQRQVYRAVLAAQEAGISAVRPGNKFRDVHEAAITVIAEHLHSWGLLPDGIDVAATLDPQGGYHRRWMVHGTSHHLGLDVHDCAQARREQYLDAELRPGMVLTVEPGLYFRADDQLVPEHLRGIGVRIEDDLLVTDTGRENLSGALPRTDLELERWMAELWSRADARLDP
ncbi:MAG: aminopeptidase P family protein [Angustibacter sp.]